MNENNEKLEVDYEKLAEAIVKAINKDEEEKQQQNSLDKGLIKFAYILFMAMGAISLLFAFCGVCAIYEFVKIAKWDEIVIIIANIFATLIVAVIIGYIVLFAIYLFRSAKEVKREKDRNYIIAIFSTIIGFISLIISIIALAITKNQ